MKPGVVYCGFSASIVGLGAKALACEPVEAKAKLLAGTWYFNTDKHLHLILGPVHRLDWPMLQVIAIVRIIRGATPDATPRYI